MKYLLPFALLILLTGCCKIQDTAYLPKESVSPQESSLYRFRLERSGKTKLSGLFALQQVEEGMRSVLLDATGVPLVKMLTRPDGLNDLEYCAAAVCDTRLPELVGKVIDYIYFIPANAECPWYAFSCTCQTTKENGRTLKWKRFGPLNLWQIEHVDHAERNEMITVHMYLSSVTVQLHKMEKKRDK